MVVTCKCTVVAFRGLCVSIVSVFYVQTSQHDTWRKLNVRFLRVQHGHASASDVWELPDDRRVHAQHPLHVPQHTRYKTVSHASCWAQLTSSLKHFVLSLAGYHSNCASSSLRSSWSSFSPYQWPWPWFPLILVRVRPRLSCRVFSLLDLSLRFRADGFLYGHHDHHRHHERYFLSLCTWLYDWSSMFWFLSCI